MRHGRWLAAFLAVLFVLVFALPVHAAAKGGFSSGSRGGFSSGGSRSFSAPKSTPSVPKSTPSVPKSTPSTGSGSFSSGSSRSFSTPSTSSSRDFTVGRSFSSGSGSFSSGSQSYSSGNDYSGVNGAPSGTSRSFNTTPRSTYPPVIGQGTTGTPYYGMPPVIIYSRTPLPFGPDYYHSWYWGMPWYWRLFFGPTYYHTPWGYHYFEPNYATFVLLLTVLVVGGSVAWGWWRMRRRW